MYSIPERYQPLFFAFPLLQLCSCKSWPVICHVEVFGQITGIVFQYCVSIAHIPMLYLTPVLSLLTVTLYLTPLENSLGNFVWKNLWHFYLSWGLMTGKWNVLYLANKNAVSIWQINDFRLQQLFDLWRHQKTILLIKT